MGGWIAGGVIAAGILIAATPTFGQTETAKYEFHVSQPTLGKALAQLAEQADLQLLVPYDLAQIRGAHPVIGRYTVSGALTLLLRDTGFSGGLTARGVITISRRNTGCNGEDALASEGKKAASFLAVLIGALGSTECNAQGAAAEGAQVEEIVVTAQKRAENVQDIPIAITAATGQALLDRNLSSVIDIVKLSPSLSLKQQRPTDNGFAIRGVGTANLHLTAQQSVGQYFDEVSTVTPFVSQLGIYDMERVEILKGPQNTLFGRNTTGGAVNFITHKPAVSDGLNGYAQVRFGNEGRRDVEGALGLPVTDTLAIRGAFQVQTRDGVFHNLADGKDIGDMQHYAARLSAGWTPGDSTTVFLSGHVGYNRGTSTPSKSVGDFAANGVSPCPLLSGGLERFEGLNSCVTKTKTGALVNPSTPDWNSVYAYHDGIAEVDFTGGVLNVKHDFGPVSLTSITGYDETKLLIQADGPGTPVLLFATEQDGIYKIFSQELRLASEGNGRLKWILGGYYSNENDDLGTTNQNNTRPGTPRSIDSSVEIGQSVNILSVYGKADLKVTKKLTVSAGLRWTQDERDATRFVRSIWGSENGTATGTPFVANEIISTNLVRRLTAGITTPCAVGVALCSSPAEGLYQKVSKLGANVSLDYKFTDDVMGYLSYAHGFKSGAFDIRGQAILLGLANAPVGPETMDAYEAGVKSTLFDRRLQLNAAVFVYKWAGLQAFVTRNGLPNFINVPKTQLYGAELEYRLALGDGWSSDGGLTYLSSKILDPGAPSPDLRKGAPVQNAPKWAATGNIVKQFTLANDSLVEATAGLRYTASQQSDLAGSSLARIPPATFLDLSLGYIFGPEHRYKVTLWSENVTAEKTCGYITDFGVLANTTFCVPNPGEPFYGVKADVRF